MANAETVTVMGMQKYEGFVVICRECHRCFHFGKAGVDGLQERALDRLAGLNGWPKRTLTAYCKALDRRWKQANRIGWMLDLTGISHPDGYDNLTTILGLPWKFAAETDWREVNPLAAFQ